MWLGGYRVTKCKERMTCRERQICWWGRQAHNERSFQICHKTVDSCQDSKFRWTVNFESLILDDGAVVGAQRHLFVGSLQATQIWYAHRRQLYWHRQESYHWHQIGAYLPNTRKALFGEENHSFLWWRYDTQSANVQMQHVNSDSVAYDMVTVWRLLLFPWLEDSIFISMSQVSVCLSVM